MSSSNRRFGSSPGPGHVWVFRSRDGRLGPNDPGRVRGLRLGSQPPSLSPDGRDPRVRTWRRLRPGLTMCTRAGYPRTANLDRRLRGGLLLDVVALHTLQAICAEDVQGYVTPCTLSSRRLDECLALRHGVGRLLPGVPRCSSRRAPTAGTSAPPQGLVADRRSHLAPRSVNGPSTGSDVDGPD